MPNGRPGDSRLHDIVQLEIPVFGPSCDGLVREIASRLPPSRLGELRDLVEGWPFAPDGTPEDLDGLFHRLAALRDRLDTDPPAPRGSVPTAGPQPPPPFRGSAGAGIAGLVIGGAAGMPIGFVAYLVARETVLPYDLWSSDAVMWAIVLAFVAACGLLGLKQGTRPGRLGHALLLGVLGFLLGAMALGVGGGILIFVLGSVMGVSQAEGAFAMGVAFTIMPLLALLGGLFFGIRAARRAWRSWRQ